MDAKGVLLQEFAFRLGLVYENVGAVPTFQSIIGESVIDFTLSRLTGVHGVTDWRVDEDIYTGSDYNAITFKVRDGRFHRPSAIAGSQDGWSLWKLDADKLAKYIQTEVGRDVGWLGTEVDMAAETFHQYV